MHRLARTLSFSTLAQWLAFLSLALTLSLHPLALQLHVALSNAGLPVCENCGGHEHGHHDAGQCQTCELLGLMASTHFDEAQNSQDIPFALCLGEGLLKSNSDGCEASIFHENAQPRAPPAEVY